MYIEISSAQNSKIKSVVSLLEKSRFRREQRLFVAEGIREIAACISNGYKIESIFLNNSITTPDSISNILKDISIYSCAPHVYSKIAYREGTEGIVAVVHEKNMTVDDIKIKGITGENPFILIIESVEKPGNLGALLRTADACGVDAVLICDPLTDLYNPNLIRASLGSFFTVQTVSCSNEDALNFVRKHNIDIFTAQLQDSEWYYNTDFRVGTAIVMGSEANGLSQFWRDNATKHIKIPMLGKMDSLNVSVSAGVLCYEVVRQRLI